ncbi:MAG: flagellar export protein FliJ [Dehalobacterium sp.]
MKKFSFPLQAVLNVREMAEDLAKQKLAHAQQQFEAEKEKLRYMEDEWIQVCRVISGDLEQIKQNHYYREMLNNRIESQKCIVAQKQSLLKKARQKAIMAERDRKVIENLKALHVKEYRQMVLAEEQKFLDEIAVLRYAGNKRQE